MIAVDTNVLVRYLTNDDAEQARHAMTVLAGPDVILVPHTVFRYRPRRAKRGPIVPGRRRRVRAVVVAKGPQVPEACDRHASRLAGANPAMALGRREHVGEGKGARRNSRCTLRKRRLARALPDGSQ